MEWEQGLNHPSNSNMHSTLAFLWTAPEILRIIPTNMAELPREMAQRADIYSLGTLLYEIYGRQGPYGDDLIDTSREELLHFFRFFLDQCFNTYFRDNLRPQVRFSRRRCLSARYFAH